jgi:hypothetical protein
MPITFESENNAIVYAIEKIVSYTRDNQYIFLAQSVWWISSIIGLQQGLIIDIDNLKVRASINRPGASVDTVRFVKGTIDQGSLVEDKPIEESERHIHPDRVSRIQYLEDSYIESDVSSSSNLEDDIHDEIIQNCEKFLEQS